jgi:hypothetical protein
MKRPWRVLIAVVAFLLSLLAFLQFFGLFSLVYLIAMLGRHSGGLTFWQSIAVLFDAGFRDGQIALMNAFVLLVLLNIPVFTLALVQYARGKRIPGMCIAYCLVVVIAYTGIAIQEELTSPQGVLHRFAMLALPYVSALLVVIYLDRTRRTLIEP